VGCGSRSYGGWGDTSGRSLAYRWNKGGGDLSSWVCLRGEGGKR
jgi:hypothetical protein